MAEMLAQEWNADKEIDKEAMPGGSMINTSADYLGNSNSYSNDCIAMIE